MARNRFFLILPLFMVIFIDALSSSLLLPLLAPMFIDSVTSILPSSATALERNFLFGFTQGISSIAMFFSAPILGDLSDKFGRRKILLLCLFGTFLGYLLSALAVIIHAVSLLLLGRLIAGLTAGSLSTAQAAVVDISEGSKRTAYIGYILFAMSLGSILGPLISGTLSNHQWVSWFHITTPLYFAALISFLNIFYLYFAFKETFIPTAKKNIKIFSGLSVFVSAFKIRGLLGLSIAFLFMQLGWATFVQFIALFLTLQYQFTASQVGAFMACIGVGFTLAFCYLLTVVTRYFSLRAIAIVSIGLIAIFMLGICLIQNELSAWILSIPAATSLAIGYSVLISLFSQEVDKNKQGWIMGLTGAISAFSFGITGLTAGMLVNLGANTPIWFAFVCLVISTFAIYFSTKSFSRKLT